MGAERDIGIDADAAIDPRALAGSVGVIEAQLARHFDQVRVIAHNAAGTVISAQQRSTGRQVAVKVIRSVTWVDDPSASAEVAAHAELSWHPHIATLYDAGITDSGLLWLCLEYAPSCLAARLERRPLDPVELLRIAKELTEATVAIHARSIVHCDIKPSNVLLAHDGGVRVTDFGIAQLLHVSPPTIDSTRGTLQYMSPEVLEGSRPTTASDIWGVGATLWAAAHGTAPFGAEHQPIGAVHAALAGFPAWDPPQPFTGPEASRLREIVGLCTSPEPAERPTAPELAGLLARPLAGPAPISSHPAPTPPVRRHRTWAAVTVVATLAAATAAVALRDDGRGPAELLNVTADEWCNAVAASDAEIGYALDRATDTLVDGGYGATAMRSALRELPAGVAAATASWRRMVAIEPTFTGMAPALSETRMRDLIVAETATYLATGQFIGAGTATRDDLSLRGLPRDIAATAAAFGRVSEHSRTACGSEGASWRDAQIRLVDAVRISLEGPRSPFFADPASHTALDADLLATVAMVQRGYFVRLVTDHPDWIIAATDPRTGSPAITAMLLGDGATAFREIALASPPVASYLTNQNLGLAMRLAATLPTEDRDGFLADLAATQPR